MPNLCTRVAVGTVYSGPVCGPNQWSCASGNAYLDGGIYVGTSAGVWIPVGGAFDADKFGIQCQAFDNAAVSIVSLQTGLSNVQSQMTALLNGQTTQALDPERLQAEGVLFGVVLAAACLIWGMKKLLGVFNPTPEKD